MVRLVSLLGIAALTVAAVALTSEARAAGRGIRRVGKTAVRPGSRLAAPVLAGRLSFHAPFSLN